MEIFNEYESSTKLMCVLKEVPETPHRSAPRLKRPLIKPEEKQEQTLTKPHFETEAERRSSSDVLSEH